MINTRKHLRQLQIVQARIKKCRASIAALNPPRPDSFEISRNVYHWLTALYYGVQPDMSLMYDKKLTKLDAPASEYLRKLGEYFVNAANYYDAKRIYDAELNKLKTEERRLKERIGID